jgi:tetratricopeptide (TPR) repeat protein
MDQFTAHLDRGWDLAQRGDAAGAEASAKRALELEASSPEAHNLLGYSAALRGEYEDALELYRQAIALDDTFLEAILNAAELCIHPLGEFEEALRLCDDALELVETDEERTDALLLRFDAEFGLGRMDDARRTCERIPEPPFANPGHAFLVGRAFFELGEVERAEQLLGEAARRDPENPEPHYYLALIRDERGDYPEATTCFLRAHDLDAVAPPAAWSLSRDSFIDCVRRVVGRLTPRLRALVDPAEVFVADAPGVEVIVEGADPRAPVLLDQLEGPGPSLRVFVYQRNIERLAGALDRVEEEILQAIEREVAGAAFGDELGDQKPDRQLN